MVTLTRAPRPEPTKTDAGRSWLDEHRTLVVLLGLVLLLGAGGLGFLLLSGGEDEIPSGPAAATLRATGAGSTGSPSPASSSGTGSGAGEATTTAPAAAGRNPFGGLGVSTTSAPGTGGSPAATAAPTGPATSQPTTQPTAQPTTVTVSRTTTVTATTTATVTGTNLYLGLYGWTGDGRPMFRVNEASATPTAGTTFATSLTYVSPYTSGALTCANVTYAGAAKSLCQGEVLKLK